MALEALLSEEEAYLDLANLFMFQDERRDFRQLSFSSTFSFI